MNIKIFLDRYVELKEDAGTQYEQNATTIKLDFSELNFLDDECVKTIHFFRDDLSEENYIGDSIIENDEFKIPKTVTEYENVLAFVQITKEDFIWKTQSFKLDFYKSLDVDKTLDEDELGILQELILEVKEIQNVTIDKFDEAAEKATEDFNKNATEKTNSFNSNAETKTTEFNNNATNKTESFNSNATSKETSYNDNATTKLNEYNENHTSKITAYNENSAEKLAEFNENAAEKIAEYDEHIEELDNIVSKKTASGESILIDDALKYKIFDCKIDGNTSQNTTTGKNLLSDQFKFEDQTINGVTIKNNGDGSFDLTGTANDTFNIYSNYISPCSETLLKPGTYYQSCCTRMSLVNENGTWVMNTWSNPSLTEDLYINVLFISVTAGETYNKKYWYQIEEGNSFTDYEEYTGGEPSPNPDYPQAINVVFDEVKIVQTGKNLFDKNGDFTHGNNNNLTTLQEDGTIKTTANFSNQRSSGQLISVDKNTNYTVSGILVESQSPNNSVIEILNENNTRIYMFEISNSANYKFSFMFNSADNEKIWISLNARDFNLSVGVYAIFDKIQIEEGSVATDYEEYQSNEHTINLQSNELVKLTDDVKDTIEIDKSGNVSLNKRTGKIVLDENTNPTIASQNYPNLFFFSLSALGMNVNSLKAISDYFTFVDDTRITDNASANTYLEYGQFAFRHGTVDRIYFKIKNITTGTDFKTWLADHNVTVYYELAEPTTSSLGQLTNFKTFASVNHFFLETNISTNFEIKYAQDLQKVISKQQAEIDELKTLLSSTATSALLLDNYASDLVSEIESEVEQ